MKFNRHAIGLAALALASISSQSNAMQVLGSNLEVYGTLYPEYDVTTYSDGSATGTANNSMQSKKLAAGNVTQSATPVQKTQINWSQSYVGVKGQKAFGDTSIGFDFQGVMGKNIDNSAFGQTAVTKSNVQGLFTDTRDAFVSISQKGVGTAQFGQMDTIYKSFGNRIKMLGVDSSNFVSTSGVLSDVGWKAASGAVTSFNTRIGNQMRFLSEEFNGFSVGYSLRPDQNRTATTNQYLTAAGARWTNGTFYVGVAQEVHNDYRTFSGSGVTESATTLQNANPGSRDTANRLSFGYVKDALQLSADFATLQYTENALSNGKFTGYKTNTYQISAEYALNPMWTISGNHVQSADGTCTISGGAACSTAGLNGSLNSLGAKYNFDKNIGLFMLYGKNSNGTNATFASSAQGGNVTNIAAGLLLVF